jgi:signal transduction histidine kinase
MAETRARLAELCRDHEIGVELIEQSQDLEQVLDRTLAECERRIDEATPKDRMQRLEGLVRLARLTRSLQFQGARLDDEALDEVDRELRAAQARSQELQQDLADTMEELERGTLRSAAVDAESLAELFESLSKLCHKINNPLTSIMGRAQMMELKIKGTKDDQLAKSVGVIQDSAKRVAGLIQELANLVCQAKKEYVESYDSKSGSR